MMKNWTKVISVMITIAIILSMNIVALAVGIATTEEMTLTGINNVSVTQATNRYFAERNAYLLSETDAMDWQVTGIVNDEAAHKVQYAEKNIVLSGISYTVDTVVCFDTHAEVSVTESVSYIKNGVAGEEQVLHTLVMYLDAENVPVVADDEYLELFSGFVSCSYVDAAELPNVTSPGGSLCIVEIAKGELGVAETGDNIIKYTEWFNKNGQPWCAMFVSWCADRANVSTSIIKKTASCTDMCNQFKSQSKFKNSAANNGNYTPVAGDIIFFGTGNTMTHVGIVATVQNGKVWFYDGNHTSEVTYRYYSLTASGIGGYGHPAYESTEHAYTGHECNETHHWRECAVCGYVSPTASHSNTCAHNATHHWQACTVCDYTSPMTVHDAYIYNDTHHWQDCGVCGYTTSAATHTASLTYEYNSAGHWNPCATCGIKMNEAAHVRIDLGYGQYKCRFCDCRIFPEFDLDKIEIDIIGG